MILMREQDERIWNEAMERAAKKCDDLAEIASSSLEDLALEELERVRTTSRLAAYKNTASSIRALKRPS